MPAAKRGDRRRKHLARSHLRRRHPPSSLASSFSLLAQRPSNPPKTRLLPISTVHLSRPPPTYLLPTPFSPSSCNSFRINPRFSNAPRCFPARIYPLPLSIPRPPFTYKSATARGISWHRIDRVLGLPLGPFLSFTLFLSLSAIYIISPILSFGYDWRSTVLSPFPPGLSISVSVPWQEKRDEVKRVIRGRRWRRPIEGWRRITSAAITRATNNPSAKRGGPFVAAIG